MNPELSIIIVNWNGIDFLPACIESIYQNPPDVSFEVVVVDNASSDGSMDWLKNLEHRQRKDSGNFQVIESTENLGFGKANNLAIASTSGRLLFLLNPDTLVRPGSLNRLIEVLTSRDDIGVTAPKLLDSDLTLQPSVWGFPPTPTQIIVEGLRLHRFLPKRILATWLYGVHWSYDQTTDVPIVAGAAMLFKRDVFETLGLAFDPSFHMYGEDLELCMRIRKSGWKIVFVDGAEIIHFGGQSSNQRWDVTEKAKIMETAFVDFQISSLSRFQTVRNLIAKAIVFRVLMLRRRFKGEDNSVLKPLYDIQINSIKRVLLGTES